MNKDKYYKWAFNAISQKNSNYDKFEMMKLIIDSAINDAMGNSARDEYEVLRNIISRINNTGWEKKKSEVMDIIDGKMEYLSETYEEYLP